MTVKQFKSWFYIRLNQDAWGKEGLSPLNRIVFYLIVFNLALQVLETEETITVAYPAVLSILDWGITVLFTIEFLLRLWSYGVNEKYAGFKGRLRFLTNPYTVIDLLALSSFYVTSGGTSLLWLRSMRVVRFIVLGSFGKHSEALKLVFEAIQSRKFELEVTMMFAVLLMLGSSTVLYLCEGSIQPEQFGSIPRALWWSVVTLTSVGYGDVYPVTVLGKIFASITAFLGIGLVAMPTGILAAAFSDAFQKHKNLK